MPALDEIETLIKAVSKLPGLGPRSARRLVLDLLKKKNELMLPLAKMMIDVAGKIKICKECGNLDAGEICGICGDDRRDIHTLCVVEDVADVWAIERTGLYKGLYHVLGGTLSAIDGRSPESLGIERLHNRVLEKKIEEIILATNATVEGQATAHYISEVLKTAGLRITRLSQGVPIGGELDYLDEGTLGAALKLRQVV